MLSETTLHRIVGATVLVGIGAIVLPILFSNVRVEYSNQLGERGPQAAIASNTPTPSQQLPQQTAEQAAAQSIANADLDKAATASVQTAEAATQTVADANVNAAVYTESKPVAPAATTMAAASQTPAPKDSLAMQQSATDVRNDKPVIVTAAAEPAKLPSDTQAAVVDKPVTPVQPVLLAALDPVVAASQPSHSQHVAQPRKSKPQHVGQSRNVASAKSHAPQVAAKKRTKKKKPLVQAAVTKYSQPVVVATKKANHAPAKQHYAVQLGLFAERQHAKKLTADLRRQGFKVTPMIVMNGNGKVLTRVVLSPVNSHAEAKQQLNHLRAKTKMPGIIISV